jgi:hypothetical protein
MFSKIGGVVAEASGSAIVIHSYTLAVQPGSPSSDRPTESLSFNFSTISITYTEMSGTQTGTNPGGFAPPAKKS